MTILAVCIGLMLFTGLFVPVLTGSMPAEDGFDNTAVSSVRLDRIETGVITFDGTGIHYGDRTYSPGTVTFYLSNSQHKTFTISPYGSNKWQWTDDANVSHDTIIVSVLSTSVSIDDDPNIDHGEAKEGEKTVRNYASTMTFVSGSWTSSGIYAPLSSPMRVYAGDCAMIQGSTSTVTIAEDGQITGSISGVTTTNGEGYVEVAWSGGVYNAIGVLHHDGGEVNSWWKLIGIIPIMLLVSLIVLALRNDYLTKRS